MADDFKEKEGSPRTDTFLFTLLGAEVHRSQVISRFVSAEVKRSSRYEEVATGMLPMVATETEMSFNAHISVVLPNSLLDHLDELEEDECFGENVEVVKSEEDPSLVTFITYGVTTVPVEKETKAIAQHPNIIALRNRSEKNDRTIGKRLEMMATMLGTINDQSPAMPALDDMDMDDEATLDNPDPESARREDVLDRQQAAANARQEAREEAREKYDKLIEWFGTAMKLGDGESKPVTIKDLFDNFSKGSAEKEIDGAIADCLTYYTTPLDVD